MARPDDQSASGATRSRTTRACDNCKSRRARCQLSSEHDVDPRCTLCRENHLECLFTVPSRRRGPQPGFRRGDRVTGSSPTNTHSAKDPYPSPLHSRAYKERREELQRPAAATSRVAPMASYPDARFGNSLQGIPPYLVDELLAVYFTHVHNVWPLIYKPLFNLQNTSTPLLLAILAIASCLAPVRSTSAYDSERLFKMAESCLGEALSRDEYRLDTIQALVLLSLRQTGNGHKQSAFMYAGRACVGVLSMGLNLKSSAKLSHASRVESDIRSRVYWIVYVLDKTLAEETGRPFLLPYRRSSTPLPSTNETDELETWPPLPMSSAPLPQSVQHVTPRRGYVMSCFTWTCRLAILSEDVLCLEVQTPAGTESWDAHFDKWKNAGREQDVEGLATQLRLWRQSLPIHLEVDLNPSVSPLPHHAVAMAWYHNTRILLFSRFTQRRYPGISPFPPSSNMFDQSHEICAQAAQDSIDIFAHLDRFNLLTHASSDAIHILSITTLFEAFDSTNPDEGIAHRAKVNFAQCCIWLRDFSSSWPTASAHKLFFEGLIQGGLCLTSLEDEFPESLDPDTPGISGGLRNFSRDLSAIEQAKTTARQVDNTPSDIFQLPQFYWNQLTNADGGGPPWDQFAMTTATSTTTNNNGGTRNSVGPGGGETTCEPSGALGPAPSPPWHGAEGVLHENPWPGVNFEGQTSDNAANHNFTGGSNMHGPTGAAGRLQPTTVENKGGGQGVQDQSAIYAALMSYIVQAGRAQ